MAQRLRHLALIQANRGSSPLAPTTIHRWGIVQRQDAGLWHPRPWFDSRSPSQSTHGEVNRNRYRPRLLSGFGKLYLHVSSILTLTAIAFHQFLFIENFIFRITAIFGRLRTIKKVETRAGGSLLARQITAPGIPGRITGT